MGKLNVRIIDEQNGIKSISDARAVRIKDKRYSLLIMEDYTPALGEIKGDVYVLTEDDELSYKNMSGFFKQKDNEFTLLVERHGVTKSEEGEDEAEADENDGSIT